MPDDEAFMALALCNTHGELTPLERGMHALRSGMSVRGYAEKVGRPKGTVDHEMRAALATALVNGSAKPSDPGRMPREAEAVQAPVLFSTGCT